MNNFNELNNYIANFQFDWQSIIGLIVIAIVLYIAFKIGAFVLKIVVGLAVIALIAILVIKLLPFLGL
ncbi:MAG: hypothetical protein GXO34_02785 [Deltaproteobacteria bacterium]|nr:hypothetical protein [Deltaproteobacteria bacterium]